MTLVVNRKLFKHSFLIFLTLFLNLAAAPFSTQVAPKINLTVKIYNLANRNGQICARIYSNKTGFPILKGDSFQEIFYDLKTAPNKKEVTEKYPLTLIFSNITQGTKVAVSVLHDENVNRKADLSPIGIPTEGTGTSLNIRPKFSAPSFKDSSMLLLTNTTIDIRLFY